jgi:NTE family protein
MPEQKENKLGLALSGGGYRAAAYHIGTFRKLRELELLDKVDVISTNSGGSITGACYSLYHADWLFRSDHTTVFGVTAPLKKSTQR